MRPPLRPLLTLAVLLGAATGAAEVALRASPLQGLGVAAIAGWLGVSVGLGGAFGLGAGLASWAIGRRTRGLVVAAFVGMHAAINYRFELVLNEFVRDPRVWGGIGGILLLALLLGLAVDPVLRQLHAGARRGLVALLLVSTVVAFVRARPTDGRAGERPNVLVISLDTTRSDHLSPYGHAIETPTLARLAREGVAFDQAIAAAPITEPSHLAMFTGRPPIASGVVSNGTNLGDRPDLLWRQLRERGYLTAGFVSGFPLHGKYGWTQGFDVYDDDFGAIAGVQSLSLVKAWKADKSGNLIFRRTARNFNPAVIMAGKVSVVEVEEIVETGTFDPDAVQIGRAHV